jgi:hypothetical protein
MNSKNTLYPNALENTPYSNSCAYASSMLCDNSSLIGLNPLLVPLLYEDPDLDRVTD